MNNIFTLVKEHLTMRQVAEHFNFSISSSGFIFSPLKREKTASCKLYRDSFFDFSTNTGGDCIKFASLVLCTDNRSACQYLIKAFSLPISLSGAVGSREEIEQLQKERQRKEDRELEFKTALFGEIDCLRHWADVYQMALEKRIYEPFCDEWACCINELQKAEYKLDILCMVDPVAYRRMKPKSELSLPTGRPQWILDALSILAEEGVFQVTEDEMEKIKALQDVELNRPPQNMREGEKLWEQKTENLRQMSDSDLAKLLQNYIGES